MSKLDIDKVSSIEFHVWQQRKHFESLTIEYSLQHAKYYVTVTYTISQLDVDKLSSVEFHVKQYTNNLKAWHNNYNIKTSNPNQKPLYV
jgi:hypothetical protein